MQRGGGELVSFFAKEPDLAGGVREERSPRRSSSRDEREILEDAELQLVVSAAIPNERAPLGIRVMQHGKDYMADKPGITTLEQLAEVRSVQAETRRIYSILYSERFENRATVAGRRAGEGGRDRPRDPDHRARAAPDEPGHAAGLVLRRARVGGILCDIASHQVDQFLFFTGSTRAEVVASQVGNVHHPDHPGFEDFGDVDVARRRRHRLHPRRLVHARRPRHLGRRAADHPRHRRLHRDPQERRHRGPAGRKPPLPRGPEGDALRRLRRPDPALRRAAGGRRR